MRSIPGLCGIKSAIRGIKTGLHDIIMHIIFFVCILLLWFTYIFIIRKKKWATHYQVCAMQSHVCVTRYEDCAMQYQDCAIYALSRLHYAISSLSCAILRLSYAI